MKTRVRTVTPSLAKKWLTKGDPKQRRIRPTLVAKYVRSMKASLDEVLVPIVSKKSRKKSKK